MCVAVDDAGFEINSIDPGGGADEWTGTTVNGDSLYGISCPNTSGCSVVDSNGNAAWGGATPSSLTLPAIRGQAIQGGRLTEVHGTWTPSPTRYTLQWERCDARGNSCSNISGATGASYTLGAADAGSTIRVLELASNASGDGATVESAQTAVVRTPAPPSGQGAPTSANGKATINGATTRGTTAKVRVSCVGSAGATCSLVLTMTVRETIKKSRVTAIRAKARPKQKIVILGTTTVKLAAGQSQIAKLSLNSVGKRLLSHKHKLNVKLAITESGKTVLSKTITFKRKPKEKR
jgi:hypothetical protein